MTCDSCRMLDEIPFVFDPSRGDLVMSPPGDGYGNWVGGRCWYDESTQSFALFFRERRPLEEGRAGSCGVALSQDGVSFEIVWSASKEQFAANSIEEGHCVHSADEWLLYVSYEIAGTTTWRIDMMSAADPSGFVPQSRRTVLDPNDYGLAWIKDPFLMRFGDEWFLYAAAPPRHGPQISDGGIKARSLDATVLAKSSDGRYFPEIGYVFEATLEDNWHGRRARINSMVPFAEGYLAFWDGGRTFFDNYEEKAGLAYSPDGLRFERIRPERPWLHPHGVRYVSAVVVGDLLRMYYEFTRPDGAHELRTYAVPIP